MPRNFAVMAKSPRIPTLALSSLMALAIAACSDSSMMAPHQSTAALAALPQAARYMVVLATPGAVPTALASAIKADGGRIVRVHTGTGFVVVSGLSATAAGNLRGLSGVGSVLADKQRHWVHEHALTAFRPSGLRNRSAAAPALAHAASGPASAPFYTSGQEWWTTNIGADTAWASTSQGNGETVFILDTGVDTLHQDLKGRIDTKRSTSFATAPAGDSVLPFGHDVFGHGTFVTSEVTGNSVGVAAIAPNTKVVMVRVLDDSGSGFDSDILSGVLYAADSSAAVISMSLGGYLDRTSNGDLAFADMFQRAVDYARARGSLIVVAAGNEAVNTVTAMAGSASYVDSLNIPAGLHNLISVGATGPIETVDPDQIAVYSNFGSSDVAVFAPGGNNLDQTYEQANNFPDWVIGACSTASPGLCPGDETQYVVDLGTSMATPMVAAEAAILLAQTKGLSPSTVEACILNAAAAQGTGKGDINWNFGRISIPSALKTSGC
jgi:serine protease